MEETQIPQQPQEVSLGNIALALSGGGYRAAAFHLGVLDFLHQVDLLDTVTMLSTVSGGSITGARYVMALTDDPTQQKPNFFRDFYDSLYTFLERQPLPDGWLKEVSQQSEPSLIRAASRIYGKEPDRGGLLGDLRFSQVKESQSQFHLKEIVFNATELHTGLGFRFRVGDFFAQERVLPGQESLKDNRVVGSKHFQLKEKVVKQIRLADAVAASSCFSGGFEPIIFPQDFAWEDSLEDIQKQVKSSLKTKDGDLSSLPLMDGGIYDGLGVQAILFVDNWLYQKFKIEKDENLKKIIQKKRFRTIILSDVDNIGIDEDPKNQGNRKLLLTFKSPKKDRFGVDKISLKTIVKIFIPLIYIVFLFSTIISGWLGVLAFLSRSWLLLSFMLWVMMIFLVTTVIILLLHKNIQLLIRPSMRKVQSSKNGFIDLLQNIVKDWTSFLKTLGDLEIADVVFLIQNRFQSLVSLVPAFLSNQRRQVYDLVYESDRYRNKAISCFIYDMKKAVRSAQNSKALGKKLPLELSFVRNFETLAEMAKCAEQATNTQTLLWFDPSQGETKIQLNTLIACGQFTICFNLLQHLNRRTADGKSKLSPETEKVYELCLAAWENFEQDPKCWVGEHRQQSLLQWEQDKAQLLSRGSHFP